MSACSPQGAGFWAWLLCSCIRVERTASGAGGGPEQLVLFLVARPGAAQDAQALRQACQAAIARKLNPLFKVGVAR